MTYHSIEHSDANRTNTRDASGLVRSSGGTRDNADNAGSLTGQSVIPDPMPPMAPTVLVSTTAARMPSERSAVPALPGLEPVPGYVPRPDLIPEQENTGVAECRPMPADCHAPNSEQEEFILVRRCGWQPRRRPNRSMDNKLERQRLFGRGSRTRGFLKRLGDRLSDNGVGRGGLIGDVLGSLEAATAPGTLEVVVGPDDRVLIEDTTLSPFSGNAQLEIIAQDGREYVGTAALVGRTQGASVFLTAAHCIHYPEGGGFAKKITVSPGRNGEDFPFGRYVVEPAQGVGEILAPQGWIDSGERTQDWGLIVVPDQVQGPGGEIPHVFTYAALSDAAIAGAFANVAGYPVDLNNLLMFGDLQFYHAERITGITDLIVTYQTDTTGGQSGSAVFQTDPGTGERLLMAVHTMGDQLHGNSATRITSTIAAQIDAVIASMG